MHRDAVTAADRPTIAGPLHAYQPADEGEAGDLARARTLVETANDPWSRQAPLHLTASAMIVHPDSQRVLLRWHPRQRAWLQVGGHADPGETDPMSIALREGREETGLDDLLPWPDDTLIHLVVVPVAETDTEPAHEHVDLRYVLATRTPEAAQPEHPDAALRWLHLDEAVELTHEPNVHETLRRVHTLFAANSAR